MIDLEKEAKEIYEDVIKEFPEKHQDFYLVRDDLYRTWLLIARHEAIKKIEAKLQVHRQFLTEWEISTLKHINDFHYREIKSLESQKAKLEKKIKINRKPNVPNNSHKL